MAHFEKELERRELYRGRIFTVTTHRVELEDGGEGLRDVVNHSGGACVAALDKEGRVLLVRQYRFAAGRELLELPAGKLDHGAEEDVLLGAKRELSEETGLEASEWTYLGHTLASPGFCDEALHMYLARGLIRKPQHLDEDEFLDVVTMPFDKLVEQVMDGSITDGKTVSTTLKVKVLLGL